MRNISIQLEYAGKGIALGLLALLPVETTDWRGAGVFFPTTLAALAIVLGISARQMARKGFQTHGRLPAFVLFLLLESPTLIYAGLLAGMTVGIAIILFFVEGTRWHLPIALAAGAALGLLFWLIRSLDNRWLRLGVVLVLAASATAGAVYWIEQVSSVHGEQTRRMLFATQILLAIPLLYLLTFTGRAEETELEIGSMCAALGLGIWLLVPENGRVVAIVVPVVLYLLYTQRILKTLRVFKHVLRGMSYTKLCRHSEALLAYRRALELDPKSTLAREGQWRVHRDIDFSKAVHDPEIMSLVDLDLCLNRAKELLNRTEDGSGRLEEAHKLLSLVLDQRPLMQPAVYYWRAVAHMQAREYDKAEQELRAVLDPADYAPDDRYRQAVLLPCWRLALVQDQELRRRLGEPLITTEGRRLEAIAVVEAHLARSAENAIAKELKQLLYACVNEGDYERAAESGGTVSAEAFDHEQCLQLGMERIGDSAEWKRGAEYLRMAARGLTSQAPGIYQHISQVCRQAGDEEGGRYHAELAKLAGREVGWKNLIGDQRQAYFAAVQYLGESAYARGEADKAIENLSLYAESNESGLDTLRLLTELHEKKGDVLEALHVNERALVYDPKSKLLQERRDRYYYSITPEQLQEAREGVRKAIDIDYCVRKARSLLDWKGGGPEQVDWALHLVNLAFVVKPKSASVLTLCGRARLRRNEQEAAVPLLEQARAAKANGLKGDDQEAWYLACRILGDLYLLSLGKPDLALQCLADYRDSPKSGADTLYKMGQCYEQLGDRVKAGKCYQHVTIYSDHPLVYDANIALQRLESST